MAKLIMEVLISCMRQKDFKIIERTNIQSDAIVINQSDCNKVANFKINNEHCITFITTTERGLSKSRNMALKNAKCDICLICDDDEILYDNYPDLIIQAFNDNPSIDIIAFQIANTGKKYSIKKKRIGYIGALKLASWQLAFRRKSIINNDIQFDETLGSGVSNAGGEENLFVYDCLKRGLKVIFMPVTIGRMIESESQWFHGFTPNYFYDRGIMTRKLMGPYFATLYAIYFLIKKYKLYHNNVSLCIAAKNMLKTIYKK